MVVSPRPERAGQADQDGRPSGAALPAIDLSVVRGVGSSTVVPGSVGSYRPVIAGAKLREGTTTILPRGGALQGVGLSSMRFHPIGGGLKTTKMDKKHGSRQETHPLSDRPDSDSSLTTHHIRHTPSCSEVPHVPSLPECSFGKLLQGVGVSNSLVDLSAVKSKLLRPLKVSEGLGLVTK